MRRIKKANTSRCKNIHCSPLSAFKKMRNASVRSRIKDTHDFFQLFNDTALKFLTITNTIILALNGGAAIALMKTDEMIEKYKASIAFFALGLFISLLLLTFSYRTIYIQNKYTVKYIKNNCINIKLFIHRIFKKNIKTNFEYNSYILTSISSIRIAHRIAFAGMLFSLFLFEAGFIFALDANEITLKTIYKSIKLFFH